MLKEKETCSEESESLTEKGGMGLLHKSVQILLFWVSYTNQTYFIKLFLLRAIRCQCRLTSSAEKGLTPHQTP